MPGPRRSTLVLALALLAACSLVVVLGKRQIELNQAYAELRLLATRPHAGYVVPAFATTTLSGDTLTVGESPDSTALQVLFVLTTTCPYCQATLPVWAGLADSLRRSAEGRRVQVIALVLDSLPRVRGFALQHHLGYPVATFPKDKFRRLYRAGSVPQTVVLDAAGEVLYAHVGQLTAGPVLDSIYRVVAGRPPGTSRVAGRAPAARVAVAGGRP